MPVVLPPSLRILVLGTGSAVPARRLTNAALIKELGLDTTDAWIREHIGVEARHWVADGEATSDLAAAAGRRCLEAAGRAASDVARIVVATSSGDWPTPATACAVQAKLGASCPAEDKVAACAGFLFALDHAARLVATGVGPVLVIGADAKSRFLDRTDRLTCSIFGDGAGAALIGPGAADGTALEAARDGLLAIELWTDGTRAEDIHVPAGGSRMPASPETVRDHLHGTRIKDGRTAFREAVELQSRFAHTVLDRAELTLDDVAWFVPHQANRRIVEATADALGIARERTLVNVDRFGNTVAAGLPMGLDELARDGRLRDGDVVLLSAVGAGFTGGAAVYRHRGAGR